MIRTLTSRLSAAIFTALPATFLQAQTVELSKLSADDGTMNDYFGRSVSIWGGRALVGASNDYNEQGILSGSAYILDRKPNGTWVNAAKLVSSDPSSYKYFGLSVSVSRDRALVGAKGDDELAPNSGAAYVFDRQPDGSWVQTAKLLANDGGEYDHFGVSVSLSEDRAIVGANGDGVPYAVGSAYVFDRQLDGTWKQTAKLEANDANSQAEFGVSVSLSGGRALVGAKSDDDLGFSSGSAYLFERQLDGTWFQTAKLKANDGGANDMFGISVSLSGDRALVGAYWSNQSGPTTGAAYVFDLRTDNTWLQSAKLKANDAGAQDSFGYSVSLSGDRALVGAFGDSDLGIYSGSAYLFERKSDGAWFQTAKLKSSDSAAEDKFGVSVSLSGDLAIAGDYYHDNGSSPNFGAAYVFDAQPLSGKTTEVSLSAFGSQPLEVDAGTLHAGENYLVLGSISGTSTGVPVPGGLTLPLNEDSYFKFTFQYPNTPPLTNSLGILNAAGHADALFKIPANLNPHLFTQLAGLTLHHAFATFSPGGKATFVSNPLPVTLIP